MRPPLFNVKCTLDDCPFVSSEHPNAVNFLVSQNKSENAGIVQQTEIAHFSPRWPGRFKKLLCNVSNPFESHKMGNVSGVGGGLKTYSFL